MRALFKRAVSPIFFPAMGMPPAFDLIPTFPIGEGAQNGGGRTPAPHHILAIFPRILRGFSGKMPWLFGNEIRMNPTKNGALQIVRKCTGKIARFAPLHGL
jgi:hypothetical protein